jgi:hypothetical protein
MNWDAIGAIGNLVSGLGVIVTVAYLALQMRQNTLYLQRAEMNAGMSQFSAYRVAIMTSPDLAKIIAEGTNRPDALSAPDLMRARTAIIESIWGVVQTWDRDRLGASTSDHWNRGMQEYVVSLLGTPLGRIAWAGCKESTPASFRAEVDRLLAAAAPSR